MDGWRQEGRHYLSVEGRWEKSYIYINHYSVSTFSSSSSIYGLDWYACGWVLVLVFLCCRGMRRSESGSVWVSHVYVMSMCDRGGGGTELEAIGSSAGAIGSSAGATIFKKWDRYSKLHLQVCMMALPLSLVSLTLDFHYLLSQWPGLL